jgi:hypothetical protein
MKLLRVAGVIEGMAHCGHPEHLILYIGMLEVGCTIVYLIPRAAILGAILMTGYWAAPLRRMCVWEIRPSSDRSWPGCSSGQVCTCAMGG